MSNEAQVLLNKIQRDRDTLAAIEKLEKINPYPLLIVYKARRAQLATAIAIAVGAGTFVAQVAISTRGSIHDSSLVLLAIGAAMVLVPLTEEWAYTPWQAKPHKSEKIEHE